MTLSVVGNHVGHAPSTLGGIPTDRGNGNDKAMYVKLQPNIRYSCRSREAMAYSMSSYALRENFPFKPYIFTSQKPSLGINRSYGREPLRCGYSTVQCAV